MPYDYPSQDDEPVSTFEDLDSAEQPGDRQLAARRVYKWEAIIGIGLLLVLVGFAVGQWRDTQAKQDRYRSGQEAAAAWDWPAARNAFSSIHGFRDADQQAAQAAKMLTYTLALSGTVALRDDPLTPGLYYYGTGGWHYLLGSDLQSRILGTCSDGQLFYDVPWSDAVPTPEPLRQPPRGIAVASRSGAQTFLVSMDATRYNNFLCTGGGLWASTAFDSQASNGGSHLIAPYLTVEHQDFYHALPTSPSPPDSSLIISAIMPDGQHLLLSNSSDPGGTGENWHTRLYIADANASDPVLLSDFPGAPGPAPYATVGDNLLFTMYAPLMNTAQGIRFANSVILIRPDHTYTTLAKTTIDALIFDDHFQMQVVGINQGKRAGQALIVWSEGNHSIIRVIDINGPGKNRDLQTSEGITTRQVLSIDPASGSILIGADNIAQDSFVNLVYVDEQNRLREIGLAASSLPGSAADAWVRQERIVYSSGMVHMASDSSGGPFAEVFQTLPIDRLSDTKHSATLAWLAVPGLLPGVGLPWHAGDKMFTYLTPSGEIHAINYDGTGDTTLDRGVLVFSQFDVDAHVP